MVPAHAWKNRFAKMEDDILEDIADHVNSLDSFCDLVTANSDRLSENNKTEKPSSYSLSHSTQHFTHIITGSNVWIEYELHFDHTNWLGHSDTPYVNSKRSFKLLTYVEQDFNTDDDIG